MAALHFVVHPKRINKKNSFNPLYTETKAQDCSESKKEYIRELIKGIKTERTQFTKELTNEFMFTRLTMVKGLRFVKANNSFYA
jgi:hypothetical protein